jgi:hypothetical protein
MGSRTGLQISPVQISWKRRPQQGHEPIEEKEILDGEEGGKVDDGGW